ncbi:MAG: hypothetical protein ACKVU1_01560 [bacterium]
MLVEGEEYYRISGYHRMPPFLMSIPSDTDLWMFVSSGGGITAGRANADGSLFPYETVDKLHDGHHHTGPITLVRVRRKTEPSALWQPFSERSEEEFRIDRNLYKNAIGNRLIFEEINHDLGLAFRYRWAACDALGLVRTSTLTNRSADTVAVSLLDGLRNILPYGAPLLLYQRSSCLVDAYKRTDCDRETRLGIYSLTAQIVDRAEAVEQLRANTVWCHGLRDFDVCLSADAIASFRRGEAVSGDTTLTGRRGNYLVVSSFELEIGAQAQWHLVADVARSHVDVAGLRHRLRDGGDLDPEIEESIRSAGKNLLRNIGSADGIQLTGHAEANVHHSANVLFNNMRGGVFAKNYDLPTADLRDFLWTRNRAVASRHDAFLGTLPVEISAPSLVAAAQTTADPDFQRLSYEYLPLHFGRRHGDPSRPWNQFSIRARGQDGSRMLHYEGNWRDIFQNWEALGHSFPGFLPGIIAKFVNASTVDGFNPYRITRDGVEWEVTSPDDPWSYIGYWGDHQVVYLLRLLEALQRFSPGVLESLLEREIFCYADVPYRLKAYEEIREHPRATIDFDNALASRIDERVLAIGTDGKLLPGSSGAVYHVNLFEKLLVPALSKLSNFVPDGGLWMNTQRPEWNDANNALSGNGLSVVTSCHLRRYLSFLAKLLETRGDAAPQVSIEVANWFREIRAILDARRARLAASAASGRDRMEFLDAVGAAFSEYRRVVYSGGFSGKTALPIQDVVAMCRTALAYLDHAITANEREDGLYHSYNLLEVSRENNALLVHPLYEMLEGQVAALSSGLVNATKAADLVARLFESKLYRADQKSFMLYPERELPGFLERNVVPDHRVAAIPLLRNLLGAGENSIVARDASGVCRFNSDFRYARDLEAALGRLSARDTWAELVAADRRAVLETFEDVFQHRSFTGRSGTMYGYEGLGCIYWHMVAKLLLAIQEIAIRAAHDRQPAQVVERLAEAYYRVRTGLGFEKSVREYGAFPTDPYSHTPRHAGAQQPGMTGQVKEEILARFGELGVDVENGLMSFRPVLLRRSEFRGASGTYRYCDLAGRIRTIPLPAGALAFSFCQVPVVYELTQEAICIRVTRDGGSSTIRAGAALDEQESRSVFDREGRISRIDVGVPERSLLRF